MGHVLKRECCEYQGVVLHREYQARAAFVKLIDTALVMCESQQELHSIEPSAKQNRLVIGYRNM